jgi:hypothetical protein
VHEVEWCADPEETAKVTPNINGRSIAPARSIRAADRGSVPLGALNHRRDQRNSQAPTAKSVPVIKPVPSDGQKAGVVPFSFLSTAAIPQSNPNEMSTTTADMNVLIPSRLGRGKSVVRTVRGAAGTPAMR